MFDGLPDNEQTTKEEEDLMDQAEDFDSKVWPEIVKALDRLHIRLDFAVFGLLFCLAVLVGQDVKHSVSFFWKWWRGEGKRQNAHHIYVVRVGTFLLLHSQCVSMLHVCICVYIWCVHT